MNALQRFWTEEDKLSVAEMVEKIFVLNDRNIDSDKKALYVSEMERSGYQVYDFIKVLDEMTKEVIKFFKLGEVIQRIREHKAENKRLEIEAREKIDCEYCNGVGHVTLINGKYGSAFACKCENGNDFARKTKSEQWKGDNEQIYKNEVYKINLTT
jgi:hypothetical protein